MPNIQVTVCEGFDDACKARLIADATGATVAALDAPRESVRVWLCEIAARDFAVGGMACAGGARPQAAAGAIFQAVLIAGRSDAQKARLIEGLTASAAGALAIAREHVRVMILDIPNTDFGVGGDTAASLGRGIGRARQTSGSQAA
ncbi:tautomerase family protein [Paraburkholderia unamae]|uniref:4-oxalocrotonate tautomerase family enzyme n=1 Tax=Paraburkholderia unamae TaxID=219649 RepID=A0ABX5KC56_9BURK|nr:tautomerase family protein [Paraburkholderia unamae]PVX70766.1 4-oxalocrotonate tautomerase family enzyme [Paraburkholderia unamae]CAG9251581.1 4-oxalocrotonate tautomerase family enzyme [Paraburkholderia unamae]